MPPSSDGPGSGAKGKPRGKFGGKRGGQKGHRGHHRSLLPPESVDAFIELFPEVCLGCGHALRRTPDAAACRYQQLDLRDHRPHLTEWRRHEVRSERCGAATRAEYDRTQLPSFAFGPCLTAVVVRPRHPGTEGAGDLAELAQAALIILKGDANCRRLCSDTTWDPETPFDEVVAGFPAPLCALRTLKVEVVVDLPPGLAARALGRGSHLDGQWPARADSGAAGRRLKDGLPGLHQSACGPLEQDGHPLPRGFFTRCARRRRRRRPGRR